jgi:beta-lactam-binding protein with PASTA domain
VLHQPRWFPVLLLAACMSLAGCGGSTPRPAPAAPAPSRVVPSAEPAPSFEATPSLEAARSMPDVNGDRLSDAEALLGAAGFMSVRAVDATGQGRTILEKNNWVVERQEPSAGADVAEGVTVTLAVRKPTDDQGEAAVEKGIVPDVVCLDLQEAQDAMRGAGFFVVIAKDGLGGRRYPLVDRNWIVLGQSAKAGSSPEKSATIQLTVVKFGEPTGDSGCKS